MYWATIKGHDSVVKFLLENGARKSYRANGRSLAYHAARSGDKTLGSYLAGVGAGSYSDVSSGSAEYAANQARIRQQNAVAAAAALTVIGAMMSSSGGSDDGDSKCRSCGAPCDGFVGYCSRCGGMIMEQQQARGY